MAERPVQRVASDGSTRSGSIVPVRTARCWRMSCSRRSTASSSRSFPVATAPAIAHGYSRRRSTRRPPSRLLRGPRPDVRRGGRRGRGPHDRRARADPRDLPRQRVRHTRRRPAPHRDLLAHLPDHVTLVAGLVTVIAWGSAFVAIRDAGEDLSAGSLALGRLLVSAVVLGAIAARSGGNRYRRGATCRGSRLYGVLLLASTASRSTRPNSRVDAGTAAMVINTGPILIAILAGSSFKEGFPRRLFAGCAVAFARLRADRPRELAFRLCARARDRCCSSSRPSPTRSAVVVQKPVLARASPLAGDVARLCRRDRRLPAVRAGAGRRARRTPAPPGSPGSSISASRRRRSASRPGLTRCGA